MEIFGKIKLLLSAKEFKMFKKILSLVLFLSFSTAQDSFFFGAGKNDAGFTMSISYEFSKPYFLAGGGNIFSGVSDPYDFKPGLFDDIELGKVSESLWVAGGPILNFNSLKFYVGGGVAFNQEYFKYRDPSEILGDKKGIYYVTDDNSTKVVPTFYVGSMFKVGNEDSFLQYLGFAYSSNSKDFNLTFGMAI